MPLTQAQIARIREKEREIRAMVASIVRNDTPPKHQEYLRKRIEKAKKYIAERKEE